MATLWQRDLFMIVAYYAPGEQLEQMRGLDMGKKGELSSGAFSPQAKSQQQWNLKCC